MTRRRPNIDWAAYLTTFHAQRPGITEAVLTRCHNGGRNPYEWLLEGTDDDARMLDLGCGSAPTLDPTHKRCKDFAAMYRNGPALVIQCASGPYRRLVITVKNPDRLTRTLTLGTTRT